MEERDESVEPLEPCFLTFWCEMYGLTDRTARLMHKKGMTSGDVILSLQQADLNSLDISLGQKCLVRGAILQYRESKVKVDRIILAKSLDIGTPDSRMKKLNDLERVKALDSMERLPMTVRDHSENGEYRPGFRRKPRASSDPNSPQDGRTLAERIIAQRSERDRSFSVPLAQITLPSPTRSVSSAYSSPANLAQDAAYMASTTGSGDHVTRKKSKKSKKKKVEDLEVNEGVKEILEGSSSPDEKKGKGSKKEKKKKPTKTMSQSGEALVNAVKQLEDNLFTEEEQAIIESIKSGDNDEDKDKKKKDKKSKKSEKKKSKQKLEVEKSIKDDELDKMISGDFEKELDKVLSKTG